jgi:inner membrane protein
MGTTHMAFGAACGAAYAVITRNSDASVVAAGIAAFGALLPDIDHPYSTFGKKVKFISWPIAAVFGHRGITHSLAAIIAMAGGLVYLGIGGHVAATLCVGYLSHLAADALTPSGLPLMWQNTQKYHLAGGLLRTGGAGDFLLMVLSLVATWLMITRL